MYLNTVLAIIIVLIFVLSFIAWVLISSIALVVDPVSALGIIIPGVAFYGFWGIVAYRLYNCTPGPDDIFTSSPVLAAAT